MRGLGSYRPSDWFLAGIVVAFVAATVLGSI